MAQQAVGIDISERSVEVVRLLTRKGETVLAGAARAEIPAGTIRRGIVEDVPRLVAVLSDVLDELLGPKRRTVTAGVCVPEIVVFSKLFSVPASLDQEMVGKALAIEAADSIPISFEGVTSDFVTVSRDNETRDVLYSAVKNDVVSGYREVLDRTGVQPRFIDASSMALARTLLPKKEPEPVLIADIGTRTTVLVVSELGGVRSSANVPFGGDTLDEALEEKLKIDREEAEALKRKAGFDLDVEDGRLVLILEQPMQLLIGEIRKTADHYASTTGHGISRVILAGGASLMPDIVEFVGSNLSDLPVVGAEPFPGVVLSDDLADAPVRSAGILYSTAVGVALRQLGVSRPVPGVNLLPRHTKRRGVVGAFDTVAKGLGSFTSFVSRMAPRKKAKSKKKKASKPKKRTTKKADVPADAPAEKAVKPVVPVPSEQAKTTEAATDHAPSPDAGGEAVSKERPAATPSKAAASGERPVSEEPTPAKEEAPEAKEVKEKAIERPAATEPKKKPEAPVGSASKPMTEEPEKKAEPSAEEAPKPKVSTAKKQEAAVKPEKSEPVAEEVADDATFGEGSEHEFGRGVGDLLGSVNAVEDKKKASSRAKETAGASLPAKGGGKISIESILKRKDAGEEVFDEEDNVINEEGMQDEEPQEAVDNETRRRKGPVPALLAVLIVIVLVAATGILMFVRKNGLPSFGFLSGMLAPKTANVNAPSAAPGQTAAQASAVPSTVSVDFIAAITKGQQTNDTPVLLTRAIETDVEMSDTFPATGSQPAPQAKATGTITIVNTTSRSYDFVATTRFLSPDGILFRMDKGAHIPASGTVDVAVHADKPGPTGDIGPTTFTIPGLSATLQKVITGKSTAAMSGGSGAVKAVTQDDIDKAKAALTDKLKTESEKNFKVMVKDGERIVPDLITSKELSFTSDKVGTAGSTFTAKLSLRFRALLVPESDVLPLLKAKLAAALPKGQDPSAYTLGSTLYTVEAYDTTTERAQVRAEAPVRK